MWLVAPPEKRVHLLILIVFIDMSTKLLNMIYETTVEYTIDI